jgi:hypothetical protein
MRSLLVASTVAMLVSCAVRADGGEGLPTADADRMRPVVPAAIEYFNERSDDPLPSLTSEQIEALLDGDVVRFRRRPDRNLEDPPERVTGYVLVPQPRAQVWIAALDPDFQASDMVSEKRLGRDESGWSLWHHYISLPWPVTDRQWVIRVRPRVELAEGTGGLVWEQMWELADGGEDIARASIAAGNLEGVTLETAKDAIYVPANEGSWVMFELEKGLTLVGYRVVARVGGSIPDSWIATFGMAQLTNVLEEVARYASEIPGSYDPDVHPILGGDGKPLPRF